MNSSVVVQQLNYVVPVISVSFLVVIISIKVYVQIRKHFPATVNCWFCNQNTKVPYENLNSWTCPSCEQYNGFTPDGDYNCDIPSQRSAKLNKAPIARAAPWNKSIDGMSAFSATSSPSLSSNALCQPCNRNQELKMQQMASFEPENENYYDEEVEDFRNKLEQAYRLCPRCERHLKRTLNNVKKNILGSKLTQLGAKSLRALNSALASSTGDRKVQQPCQFFGKFVSFSLVVISTLTAYHVTAAIDMNKTELDNLFYPSVTTTILIFASYAGACKILLTRLIGCFGTLPCFGTVITFLDSGLLDEQLSQLFDGNSQSNSSSGNNVIANVAGCVLSIFVVFQTGFQFSATLSLMLWTANYLLDLCNKTSELTMTIGIIHIFLTWTTACLSVWNFVQSSTSSRAASTENKDNSFHRMYSDGESDVSEESEAESDINVSNRSIVSGRSNRYSIRSNNDTLNNSFTSQSPSVRSAATYTVHSHRPQFPSMHNLLEPHNFCNATFVRCSDRASHVDLPEKFYDENRSVYSQVDSTFNNLYRRPQAPNKVMTNQLYGSDTTGFSGRCSSRLSLNDVPDEFESGITQLSISELAKNRMNYCNSVISQRTEPASPVGVRPRNLLLQPSRLNYRDNDPQDPSISANQSSWLAGGYWNNTTSPQKRQQHASVQCYKNNDTFPIVSRTSSQSSGFESMKNSVGDNVPLPQQTHKDVEIDRLSLFSDRSAMNYGMTKHLQTGIATTKTNSFDSTAFRECSSLPFEGFSQYQRANSNRNSNVFQKGSLLKMHSGSDFNTFDN